MIRLLRTDIGNPDFKYLVKLLDAYLAEIDGDDNAFYLPLNKIDTLRQVVVANDGHQPVACGAFKEYAPGTVELKRMYTLPDWRGKGIAGRIVTELEKWAVELSYQKIILETGLNQPAAIALYKRLGYHSIANYGNYMGATNSVCFAKELIG